MIEYKKIYKYDTKGKLRVWYMQQEGSKFRTVSGLQDGKLVVSEWTQAVATNEGRSNERTGEDQAKFEIGALYVNRLTREYHDTPTLAKGGAHIFKPMLAEKYEEFEPGFAQPKLDGIRCIANAEGLWSRQGKPITGVPHINKALAPLFENNPNLILDGELYTHKYRDDFNAIVSAVKKQKPNEEQKDLAKKIEYHVYDMPSHPGNFGERINYLHKFLEKHPIDVINVVETMNVLKEYTYDNYHGECLEAGYEGSIHRLDAPYENKRTKVLKKRKEFIDEEFEVVSIEEGLGNWSGMAKSVVCRLPDDRTFSAGIKGTQERAKELLNENHNVVTIKYFQRTPDGIPRFGVATKFHGKKRTL